MDKTFSEWLLEQIKTSGYSQSEFARRAGLSRQAVSNYLNEKRADPDRESVKKIARALHMRPEDVYISAGLLPGADDSDIDDQAAEIAYRTSKMSQAEKRAVLAFMNSLEQGEVQAAPVPPVGNLKPVTK